MTYNEELLTDLMNSMKESAPVKFAETLDSVLKAKCADAIDSRRESLAAEINEAKDNEGADYTGNDADAEYDTDKEKDGDDDKGADDTVNEEDEEDEDGEEDDDEDGDDQVEEGAARGGTIKVTNAKVGVRKAGGSKEYDAKNTKWLPKKK